MEKEIRRKRFGKRLRQLRSKHNITAFEILYCCKISSTSYSQYTAGIYYPSMSTIIAFANLYNVSVDYLLCRTDKSDLYGEKKEANINLVSSRLKQHIRECNLKIGELGAMLDKDIYSFFRSLDKGS